VTSHGGKGVAEGWTRFAVPGTAGRGLSLCGPEPGGQEGDEGEQREQARCGAGDGEVRSLALGLDTEVGAGFLERDLQLPALDEPAQDLPGRATRIGT